MMRQHLLPLMTRTKKIKTTPKSGLRPPFKVKTACSVHLRAVFLCPQFISFL
jgi:hypothetical protein